MIRMSVDYLGYGNSTSYCIVPSHPENEWSREYTSTPGPSIMLHSPDNLHSALVHLWGATVTSWHSNGVERLFLSESAIYDTRSSNKKPIRGGIPIVFPQFGEGSPENQPSKMTQHGFARTSRWHYSKDRSQVTESAAIAVFTLQHNAETLAVWPHEFMLIYTITLTDSALITELQCKNISQSPWKAQVLLHTYIKVPDIRTVGVVGLEGRPYIDKLTGQNGVEDRQCCTISQEVDRVMSVAPSDDVDRGRYPNPPLFNACCIACLLSSQSLSIARSHNCLLYQLYL